MFFKLVTYFSFVLMIHSTNAMAGISLSLDSRGDPVVEYSSRPPSEMINFVDIDRQTYEVVRSKAWEVLGACAMDLNHLGMSLRDCPNPRFKLSWDGVVIDRRYPPVVKLKNGGSLVFTQYLNARDANGLEDWTVRAPRNGIAVFQNNRSNANLHISGDVFKKDGRGWVYLGPDTFAKNDNINLLVDTGIPESVRGSFERLVPAVISQHTNRLRSALLTVPSLYVIWGDRDKPSKSFQADTAAGNVLRFSLSGAGWNDASVETLENLRSVIAHELSHLWNAGLFSSEQSKAPWLHEGNAELLSINALHALGLLSESSVANRVNGAIAQCIYLSRNRSWVAIAERNRGSIPYACGLTIQFALVAFSENSDGNESSYEFWRKLWALFPAYDESKLLEFVGTSQSMAVSNALRSLLFDGGPSFADALKTLLAARKVVIQESSQTPASLNRNIKNDLLQVLLSADCSTPPRYIVFDDKVQLSEAISCEHFKPAINITSIQGLSLTADAMQIVDAIESACSLPSATYGVKYSMGETIQIPCGAEIAKKLPKKPLLFYLRNADIERTFEAHARAVQ